MTTVVPIGKQDLHHVPRQGEDLSVPTRSKRFYTHEAAWYFTTRDDQDQGPYKNLGLAKDALKTYLRRCGIVSFNG